MASVDSDLPGGRYRDFVTKKAGRFAVARLSSFFWILRRFSATVCLLGYFGPFLAGKIRILPLRVPKIVAFFSSRCLLFYLVQERSGFGLGVCFRSQGSRVWIAECSGPGGMNGRGRVRCRGRSGGWIPATGTTCNPSPSGLRSRLLRGEDLRTSNQKETDLEFVYSEDGLALFPLGKFFCDIFYFSCHMMVESWLYLVPLISV